MNRNRIVEIEKYYRSVMDRRIHFKLKVKIYETVVRPTMLYENEY